MPWKVSRLMDERTRFIYKFLDTGNMAEVCREFGISRKTGYKYYDRYVKFGIIGMMDDPRGASYHPNQTPRQIEELILELRTDRPTWGPKKLRSKLQMRHPGIKIPVSSTIGDILKRYGVAINQRKRRRRAVYTPGPLSNSTKPNDIWCIDFKGQFRLGNGQYCYPLTISDHYSRYLLCCECYPNTQLEPAQLACERVFMEYGLPDVILSDNGAPFGNTGLMGWSRLSVWFLRLGIRLERIEPGHPEQNGRHERFHCTLKAEATRPASEQMLQQQERFDEYIEDYNFERPHEAIGMQVPGAVYERSSRAYPTRLGELEYPVHDLNKRVSRGGGVWMRKGREFYLSTALAHERVGMREVEPGIWLVSFMDYDLGWYIDKDNRFVTDRWIQEVELKTD